MDTVASKLRFAASPLVLAVALGLLAPAVLVDDDEDDSELGDRSEVSVRPGQALRD